MEVGLEHAGDQVAGAIDVLGGAQHMVLDVLVVRSAAPRAHRAGPPPVAWAGADGDRRASYRTLWHSRAARSVGSVMGALLSSVDWVAPQPGSGRAGSARGLRTPP